MDRFNSNCFFANGIDFKEHKSTLTEMDVAGITWALGGVFRVEGGEWKLSVGFRCFRCRRETLYKIERKKLHRL